MTDFDHEELHLHTVGLRPDGRQERELRALQAAAAELERFVYERLKAGRDVSPYEAAVASPSLPPSLRNWTVINARRRFARQLAAGQPLEPDAEPPIAGDLITPAPGGVIIEGVSGIVPVDLGRLARRARAVWQRQAGEPVDDPHLDVDSARVLDGTFIERGWWDGSAGWTMDITLHDDDDEAFTDEESTLPDLMEPRGLE